MPTWLRLLSFNGPSTTEIYTLSLHDALPISEARVLTDVHRLVGGLCGDGRHKGVGEVGVRHRIERDAAAFVGDRKSTRLNSSHSSISYAVFCLKKKRAGSTAAREIRFSALRK